MLFVNFACLPRFSGFLIFHFPHNLNMFSTAIRVLQTNRPLKRPLQSSENLNRCSLLMIPEICEFFWYQQSSIIIVPLWCPVIQQCLSVAILPIPPTSSYVIGINSYIVQNRRHYRGALKVTLALILQPTNEINHNKV